MERKCSLCENETGWVVNIGFRAVALCENCSNSIMLQTAHVLVDRFDSEPSQKTEVKG